MKAVADISSFSVLSLCRTKKVPQRKPAAAKCLISTVSFPRYTITSGDLPSKSFSAFHTRILRGVPPRVLSFTAVWGPTYVRDAIRAGYRSAFRKSKAVFGRTTEIFLKAAPPDCSADRTFSGSGAAKDLIFWSFSIKRKGHRNQQWKK